MQIVIRADASLNIASGHIMRCLTLSKELRENGAEVVFICKDHAGNMIDYIQNNNFKVHRVPLVEAEPSSTLGHSNFLGSSWKTDAKFVHSILKDYYLEQVDWLICDHYALDHHWEEHLRPYTKRIMVIDDLADRKHDCDVLLDQNYFHQENRYKDLVIKNCALLIGPKYALLRNEFGEYRKKLRTRDGEIKRILVFFGSVDISNETSKTLDAFQQLKLSDIVVDVVLGEENPHRKNIENRIKNIKNIFCHIQVDNMAQFIANADLAIGAAGAITWERCCLGLPSILVAQVESQVKVIEALSDIQAVYNIGRADEVTEKNLMQAMKILLNNKKRIKKLTKQSLQLTDGQGTKRVCQVMNEIY